MQISVCPTCYKKDEITKGKHINSVVVEGWVYQVYWCEKCKESYREG